MFRKRRSRGGAKRQGLRSDCRSKLGKRCVPCQVGPIQSSLLGRALSVLPTGTRRWGRVGSMPNDEVEREHATVGVQDLERSRRTCCGEWRWRPDRASGALVAPGGEAALPSRRHVMLAEYDFKALMAAHDATRRRQPLASQQRRRHRSTGGRGVTVHHG